jgi:hypothetical protein
MLNLQVFLFMCLEGVVFWANLETQQYEKPKGDQKMML